MEGCRNIKLQTERPDGPKVIPLTNATSGIHPNYSVVTRSGRKGYLMQQIAYAVVGDGKFGFKIFGQTFETEGLTEYWENRGYQTIPVYVEMTDELKEFYSYSK